MIGKKLINTGAAGGADAFKPSNHFNTVLYTGNGSTQRIGGYINRGAVFNGSSSALQVADGISSQGTDLSFSLWFKTNDNSATQMLVDFNYTAGSGIQIYNGNISGAGKLVFRVETGAVTYFQIISASVISNNTWHQIVATWQNQAGGEAKLYVDGSEINTATSTQTGILTLGGTNQYLGSRNIGVSALNGSLDQVRIFDKALSSTEVTTLYGETHASTTIETTDIFNDNSGVALYQLDGNANDTGGVSGKFGSAAIFNGSSSQINIGTELIPATSNFSFSFWINRNTSSDSDLFNQSTSSGDIRTYFKLDSNGTFRVFSAGTNGSRIQVPNTTSAITNGQWEHIAIVRDGSNMTFYINGTGETETISGGSVGVGRGDMIIGSASASPDARIDQVRVYDTALSSSDVSNLYNETNVPTTNLVAHYKLDGDARDEQQLYDGTATNVTYGYDGTASNVTYQEATNFSPDLVWIKNRDHYAHNLTDSIRGVDKQLRSNGTNSEITNTSLVQSFDSNGFTVGNNLDGNENNVGIVAWCFNAGEDAPATNNDGTISSTVKANQEAGFSIVKWTSNYSGNINGSVGHGLNQSPDLYIVKKRNNTSQWYVYAQGAIGNNTLKLNSTDAASSTGWISAPTSTTFNAWDWSSGSEMITYNFHSVDGYQKIGSYTGSSSDVLVETGFEPAWVMVKNTTNAYSWYIIDNKRGATTSSSIGLFANLSNAEAAGYGIHFQSNGFTVSSGVGTGTNAANNNYIYLAIAADPDTTTPTVENSFDVVTYTGNGSTQSIETDFKPDLVWFKNRTGTNANALADSVRGGNKYLFSNETLQELTSSSSQDLVSFDTNGFTLGTVNNAGSTNVNGGSIVAWCWKAGDHDDNLPQINTEGSIDSTVSVNDAAGFSIVKYTGTGVNGNYGHGLSSAPELIITKNIDWSTPDWFVYHKDLGTNGYLRLNQNTAKQTASTLFSSTPTSTVVNIGNDSGINRSNGDRQIAYCFTSIAGYQKVDSYTGNGTTNVVNTGFQPRFVMVKASSHASSWYIVDSARTDDKFLSPDLSNAEYTDAGKINFTSTGFTLTSTSYNNSGYTWIYLAIK